MQEQEEEEEGLLGGPRARPRYPGVESVDHGGGRFIQSERSELRGLAY